MLSELDSHDLALAMDLVDAGDTDAFELDADADRKLMAAYRVPAAE